MLETSVQACDIFMPISGAHSFLLRARREEDADVRFVLLSVRVPGARRRVELIVKSPLYDPKSASPVASPLFDQALENYVRSLQCFGVTR